MAGWLDGPVFEVLKKGLEASSLRHQVLANNAANVDTPNFKRSDVDFQAILGTALGKQEDTLPLKQTSPSHLPGLSEGEGAAVKQDWTTSLRNDGNNVDIDREMTNVAENGLYYNSLTQAISSQLQLLRTVIKG